VQLFLVERYCVRVRPSVLASVRELDLSVSAAAERQGCCCEFLHKVTSFSSHCESDEEPACL